MQSEAVEMAIVDGVMCPLSDARIPVDDVGFTWGWTVFETLRVSERSIPLLAEHLARLSESARAAAIEVPAPVPEEILQLAALAAGPARIRVTLSGSGVRVLTLTPVSRARWGASVRCARGPFVLDPFLPGSVKHGSRAGWVVAVRRAGVDDVLMVDSDGRFTEGTTSGIIAVVEGRMQTAPADGRILASTTVSRIIGVAAELGYGVDRIGPLAEGPWDGLYIASATRGLAPVVELDGEELPIGEPVGAAVAAALSGHLDR